MNGTLYLSVRQGNKMKLSEIYQAIEELSASLPDIFDGVDIEFPLKDSSRSIGDWSDRSSMGMVVTGDGIGTKSGVYFFAKPDGIVFYIGKAAKLHSRVWDHVNTPKNVDDFTKEFPNQTFRCDDSPEVIECVKAGKALLGVATISNPDLAALVEVFLHTLHIKKTGKLPIINKQIG